MYRAQSPGLIESCSLYSPRTHWILFTMKHGQPESGQLAIDCIHSCYRPQWSWGEVIFSQASVILSRGGSTWAGTPPQDQAHTHPRDQVHPPEQCMPGDTGNKRAVRILLECILVKYKIWIPTQFQSSVTTHYCVLNIKTKHTCTICDKVVSRIGLIIQTRCVKKRC